MHMKADKKSIGGAVLSAFAPLWLFAALVMVYALSLWALSISEAAAIVCSLVPFGISLGVCIYKKIKNALTAEYLTAAVFLLSIGAYVIYILATSWNERQHDVFVFDTQGHAGYIYTMMKTGKLPETNTGLFYHPPLHPYLMGAAGRIFSQAINTMEQVFEALQLLTAYYSLLCGYVFLKILDILNIRENSKLLFFAIFSLHPSLIVFSGSINNDILCLLLSMCAVLYLMRFYKEQSIRNALAMAVFLGLAMMTKLSAVTIAPVIAVVFVYRLVRPSEGRTRKSVFINELCFGAVSIPIGMWYPIRNLIKFNQPIGYVMPIGTDHALYCGDKSFFERFIAVPIAQIFENSYCIPEDDYNIPLYLVRCSVFGEYSFDFPKWAATALLAVNCMLIIFCVFAAVYTVRNKSRNAIVLTAVSVVTMLFFAWFNIKYPNGCSMDFRYISLCLPCALGVSAVCFDGLTEGLSKKGKIISATPLVLFSALTLCLYMSEKLFSI